MASSGSTSKGSPWKSYTMVDGGITVTNRVREYAGVKAASPSPTPVAPKPATPAKSVDSASKARASPRPTTSGASSSGSQNFRQAKGRGVAEGAPWAILAGGALAAAVTVIGRKRRKSALPVELGVGMAPMPGGQGQGLGAGGAAGEYVPSRFAPHGPAGGGQVDVPAGNNRRAGGPAAVGGVDVAHEQVPGRGAPAPGPAAVPPQQQIPQSAAGEEGEDPILPKNLGEAFERSVGAGSGGSRGGSDDTYSSGDQARGGEALPVPLSKDASSLSSPSPTATARSNLTPHSHASSSLSNDVEYNRAALPPPGAGAGAGAGGGSAEGAGGSTVRREVVMRLRGQLKSREEMILEMQARLTEQERALERQVARADDLEALAARSRVARSELEKKNQELLKALKRLIDARERDAAIAAAAAAEAAEARGGGGAGEGAGGGGDARVEQLQQELQQREQREQQQLRQQERLEEEKGALQRRCEALQAELAALLEARTDGERAVEDSVVQQALYLERVRVLQAERDTLRGQVEGLQRAASSMSSSSAAATAAAAAALPARGSGGGGGSGGDRWRQEPGPGPEWDREREREREREQDREQERERERERERQVARFEEERERMLGEIAALKAQLAAQFSMQANKRNQARAQAQAQAQSCATCQGRDQLATSGASSSHSASSGGGSSGGGGGHVATDGAYLANGRAGGGLGVRAAERRENGAPVEVSEEEDGDAHNSSVPPGGGGSAILVHPWDALADSASLRAEVALARRKGWQPGQGPMGQDVAGDSPLLASGDEWQPVRRAEGGAPPSGIDGMRVYANPLSEMTWRNAAASSSVPTGLATANGTTMAEHPLLGNVGGGGSGWVGAASGEEEEEEEEEEAGEEAEEGVKEGGLWTEGRERQSELEKPGRREGGEGGQEGEAEEDQEEEEEGSQGELTALRREIDDLASSLQARCQLVSAKREEANKLLQELQEHDELVNDLQRKFDEDGGDVDGYEYSLRRSGGDGGSEEEEEEEEEEGEEVEGACKSLSQQSGSRTSSHVIAREVQRVNKDVEFFERQEARISLLKARVARHLASSRSHVSGGGSPAASGSSANNAGGAPPSSDAGSELSRKLAAQEDEAQRTSAEVRQLSAALQLSSPYVPHSRKEELRKVLMELSPQSSAQSSSPYQLATFSYPLPRQLAAGGSPSKNNGVSASFSPHLQGEGWGGGAGTPSGFDGLEEASPAGGAHKQEGKPAARVNGEAPDGGSGVKAAGQQIGRQPLSGGPVRQPSMGQRAGAGGGARAFDIGGKGGERRAQRDEEEEVVEEVEVEEEEEEENNGEALLRRKQQQQQQQSGRRRKRGKEEEEVAARGTDGSEGGGDFPAARPVADAEADLDDLVREATESFAEIASSLEKPEEEQLLQQQQQQQQQQGRGVVGSRGVGAGGIGVGGGGGGGDGGGGGGRGEGGGNSQDWDASSACRAASEGKEDSKSTLVDIAAPPPPPQVEAVVAEIGGAAEIGGGGRAAETGGGAANTGVGAAEVEGGEAGEAEIGGGQRGAAEIEGGEEGPAEIRGEEEGGSGVGGEGERGEEDDALDVLLDDLMDDMHRICSVENTPVKTRRL